jgi:hypothetical protein
MFFKFNLVCTLLIILNELALKLNCQVTNQVLKAVQLKQSKVTDPGQNLLDSIKEENKHEIQDIDIFKSIFDLNLEQLKKDLVSEKQNDLKQNNKTTRKPSVLFEDEIKRDKRNVCSFDPYGNLEQVDNNLKVYNFIIKKCNLFECKI